MTRPQRQLVLASASPRRQEALRALGLDFEIVVSHAEENLAPLPDPTDPLPIARVKAEDVASQRPDAIVLAGDTIVCYGTRALGKPGTPAVAVEMLRELRGRRHEVRTAMVVKTADGETSCSIRAPLTMRDYSDAEIAAYVATGEPLDCAGAYDIHKKGGSLIVSTEGCFSCIVGLPIAATAQLLREAGVPLPLDPAETCSDLYRRPCLAADPLTRPRCFPH